MIVVLAFSWKLGQVQARSQELHSGYIQAAHPSAAALPGTLAGSWIGSEEVDGN